MNKSENAVAFVVSEMLALIFAGIPSEAAEGVSNNLQRMAKETLDQSAASEVVGLIEKAANRAAEIQGGSHASAKLSIHVERPELRLRRAQERAEHHVQAAARRDANTRMHERGKT